MKITPAAPASPIATLFDFSASDKSSLEKMEPINKKNGTMVAPFRKSTTQSRRLKQLALLVALLRAGRRNMHKLPTTIVAMSMALPSKDAITECGRP